MTKINQDQDTLSDNEEILDDEEVQVFLSTINPNIASLWVKTRPRQQDSIKKNDVYADITERLVAFNHLDFALLLTNNEEKLRNLEQEKRSYLNRIHRQIIQQRLELLENDVKQVRPRNGFRLYSPINL